MFTFIVLIVLGVLLISWVLYRYKYYQKLNSLFDVKDVLNFETVILFSNDELVRRIRKIVKKTKKSLVVRIADNYSFDVPANISKNELLCKFDDAQNLMIYKRYDTKSEVLVADCIDKEIFDIWLDFAYKGKYRTILRREMNYLLEKGELSNSSYNEMYRRVFCFERNIYESEGGE